MKKKSIAVLLIIAVALLAASSVACAEKTSLWSPLYSGVKFLYINRFGGNDWDTLRWCNTNAYNVEVTYTIKLSDGNTTNNVITLKAGQTTTETDGDSSLAPGARVSAIGVKAK